MDSKNLAIATMSVTATVLFCGLAVCGLWRGDRAYARDMMDRGGNYVVATLALSDTEVLAIIDGELNQMNLYRFDPVTNRLQLSDRIRLDDQVFGSVRGVREQPRGAEREKGGRPTGRR